MADEVREFHRNYERCYFVLAPGVKGKTAAPWMCYGLDSGKNFLGFQVDTAFKETTLTLSANTCMNKELAKPIVPSAGYYNVPKVGELRGQAIYMSLSPERQYRKALCDDHSSSLTAIPTGSVPTDKAYIEKCVPFRHSHFNVFRLAATFADDSETVRSFPTIRTAVERVSDNREWESVAFSKYFAVSLCRGYKFPVLWHKQGKAGFFVNGQLFVTDGIFHLKDFFIKRWNVDIRPLKEFRG